MALRAVFLAVFLAGSAAADTESPSLRGAARNQVFAGAASECDSNPITKMVAGLAPECAAACPQICGLMLPVFSAYLGGQDYMKLVCSEASEWSCALKPQNVDICKPALEKAEDLGITVPQTQADFTAACESLSHEEGHMLSSRGPDSGAAVSCDSNPITKMVAGLAPECAVACPQICGLMLPVFSAYMGGQDYMKLVCSEASEWSCALKPENADICKPALDRARELNIEVPETQAAFTTTCEGVSHEREHTTPSRSPESGAAVSCDSDPITKMVADLAPECAAACPQICGVMLPVFSSYLDGQDYMKVVCSEASVWSCAFKPENVDICKPALDKAQDLGIQVPHTEAQFASTCESVSHEQGQRGSSRSPQSGAAISCDGNPITKMVAGLAPECAVACPQICGVMLPVFSAYLDGKDYMKLVCSEASEWSCALKPENVDICKPALDKARDLNIKVPQTQADFTTTCEGISHEQDADEDDMSDNSTAEETTPTTSMAPNSTMAPKGGR